MNGRKEALNHHRPLPGEGEDVREHLIQQHGGPVHPLHPCLRADVELGPDLVAVGEAPHALLHRRPIQSRRVGEQDHLVKRRATTGAHVQHGVNRFKKLRAKRWLAIATEVHLA